MFRFKEKVDPIEGILLLPNGVTEIRSPLELVLFVLLETPTLVSALHVCLQK